MAKRRRLWKLAAKKAAPRITGYVEALLADGVGWEDAADIAAAVLDAAFPFDVLVKPPWGLAIEKNDYKAFRLLTRFLAREIALGMTEQAEPAPETGADAS